MLLDSLRQPGWREIQIDGVSKKGQENQAVRIFGNDAWRLAAHEHAIWRQTKPIKRLPEHYRIRISLDYRMIVHWLPGKLLRILDVIPRQDLESWIKRHG
jgi:hypothetical protein